MRQHSFGLVERLIALSRIFGGAAREVMRSGPVEQGPLLRVRHN
ncbi:MAG: hypothetical protein OXC69_05540 [Candidatus Tectomicrobia bacterium]|nr:hypothetical protein [Candidatus Tectomicrobia bacterium]